MKLLVILQQHIDTLIRDYNGFLQPLFPDIDCGPNYVDTFIGICARYQFYKTFSIVCRVASAIHDYLQNDNLIDHNLSLIYFTKLLMPKARLYHNSKKEPVVIANKLNYVYQIAFYEHLSNLAYPFNIPCNKKKYDFNIPLKSEKCKSNKKKYTRDMILDMNIVSNNYDLNNVLKWSAEISSYPVIPPDLLGSLISTSDKRKGKCDLLLPGPDNSSHYTSLQDPVICLNCKFLNLCVGQTDDIEQRERLKCFCVWKEDSIYRQDGDVFKQDECFLDNLTAVNARTCLHLLFLRNNSLFLPEYGCRCEEHKALFQKYVEKYYNLITELQIVNHTIH
jgi:hypothetical protein